MRMHAMDRLKAISLAVMALGFLAFAFSYTHEQGYKEGLKVTNIVRHKGKCWYCKIPPLKQIVNN